MHIRSAGPGDRRFVLDLAARLTEGFELPAWRQVPEVVEGEQRDLAAWFADPARRGERMLIAEIDGRPVGVAHVVTATDFFLRRSHGHVSVLAVAAEAEGRGAGSALLDAAADWSREQGFDRLTLSVFVDNQRARRVYERNGFAPETVRYVRQIGGRAAGA